MGISYCNIYWDLHVHLPVMTHYPSSSCMGRLALTAPTTFLWRNFSWPQGTITLQIFVSFQDVAVTLSMWQMHSVFSAEAVFAHLGLTDNKVYLPSLAVDSLAFPQNITLVHSINIMLINQSE